MPATRPTKAEHQRRVNEVVRLLCEGQCRASIVQFASETWGVVERTVDDYIREATATLRTLGEADVVEQRGLAIRRHEELYKLSRDAGPFSYSEARLNLAEISKLHGLYAPERKEVFGKDGGPLEARVTLVDAIRNELKGAAQTAGSNSGAEAGAGESPLELGTASDSEAVAAGQLAD